MSGYLNKVDHFTVHPEYHFGGYAKTTPALLDFLTTFTSQTGILIDPVYTAKLFFALDDLIKKDFFSYGESILAIHTGGLIGLMSNKMLSDVQNSLYKKTLIYKDKGF